MERGVEQAADDNKILEGEAQIAVAAAENVVDPHSEEDR